MKNFVEIVHFLSKRNGIQSQELLNKIAVKGMEALEKADLLNLVGMLLERIYFQNLVTELKAGSLSQPVEILGFESNLVKILENNDIKTVYELQRQSRGELLAIKGIGEFYLQMIRSVLDLHGLPHLLDE